MFNRTRRVLALFLCFFVLSGTIFYSLSAEIISSTNKRSTFRTTRLQNDRTTQFFDRTTVTFHTSTPSATMIQLPSPTRVPSTTFPSADPATSAAAEVPPSKATELGTELKNTTDRPQSGVTTTTFLANMRHDNATKRQSPRLPWEPAARDIAKYESELMKHPKKRTDPKLPQPRARDGVYECSHSRYWNQAAPQDPLTESDFSTIDIVYSWVNGSEPIHNFKKADFRNSSHLFGSHTSRDRDSGELKASLRSFAENVKWHKGKVTIVSPGHVPVWANLDHLRLRVVHQDALIPWEEARYTFNTNTVEQFFYRLPGVSDIFVHFNDDYMVTQPTTVRDFISPKGGPILLFERNIIHGGRNKAKQMRNSRKSWITGVFHTNGYLEEALGISHGRLFVKHAPFVYCKSILAGSHRRFLRPYKFAARNHRHRHPTDVFVPFIHHGLITENPDLAYDELFFPGRHYTAAANKSVRTIPELDDGLFNMTHAAFDATETLKKRDETFQRFLSSGKLGPGETIAALDGGKNGLGAFGWLPPNRNSEKVNFELSPSQSKPWKICPPAVAKVGTPARSDLFVMKDGVGENVGKVVSLMNGTQMFTAMNDGFRDPHVALQLHQALKKRFPTRSEFERGLVTEPPPIDPKFLTPKQISLEGTKKSLYDRKQLHRGLLQVDESPENHPLSNFDLIMSIRIPNYMLQVGSSSSTQSFSEIYRGKIKLVVCDSICGAIRSATALGFPHREFGDIWIVAPAVGAECKFCYGGRRHSSRKIRFLLSKRIHFVETNHQLTFESKPSSPGFDGFLGFNENASNLLELTCKEGGHVPSACNRSLEHRPLIIVRTVNPIFGECVFRRHLKNWNREESIFSVTLGISNHNDEEVLPLPTRFPSSFMRTWPIPPIFSPYELAPKGKWY